MERQTLSVDVATLLVAKKLISSRLQEFKKTHNVPHGMATTLDQGITFALSILDQELESYGIRKETTNAQT